VFAIGASAAGFEPLKGVLELWADDFDLTVGLSERLNAVLTLMRAADEVPALAYRFGDCQMRYLRQGTS
jgi:hypothetical protein